MALTRRFAPLYHTWDEESAALEAGRAAASCRADDLALELLQARSYIHSTWSTEYGREGNEPSEPQRAFCRLQTKLAERKKALRVTTAKVGILQALLRTERQSSTFDFSLERALVRLWHSYDRLREVAKDLGFDAAGLLRTHA